MPTEKIHSLSMWETWQNTVKAALPNFAANPIYVEQGRPVEEFQSVADRVFSKEVYDPDGRLRDVEFGARVVNTTYGDVTRMWLDSNLEIDFLQRHLGITKSTKILDIGAGYGRLAVPLSRMSGRYVCVDAVPISTEICRGYCRRFAPTVEVPSLPDFLALHPKEFLGFDLAINIHSWNECGTEQIKEWLGVLDDLKMPFLFTVSHGQNSGTSEKSYYAWSPGMPSFKPLIEKQYTLVAEEEIGFSRHPHALWKRIQ